MLQLEFCDGLDIMQPPVLLKYSSHVCRIRSFTVRDVFVYRFEIRFGNDAKYELIPFFWNYAHVLVILPGPLKTDPQFTFTAALFSSGICGRCDVSS